MCSIGVSKNDASKAAMVELCTKRHMLRIHALNMFGTNQPDNRTRCSTAVTLAASVGSLARPGRPIIRLFDVSALCVESTASEITLLWEREESHPRL